MWPLNPKPVQGNPKTLGRGQDLLLPGILGCSSVRAHELQTGSLRISVRVLEGFLKGIYKRFRKGSIRLSKEFFKGVEKGFSRVL